MRIYISGSITDGGTLPPEDVASRIEGFHEAEDLLTDAGLDTLNPARHGTDPSKTWLDYMRLAICDIAQADGVATLPNWEKSRGARVEVELARGLGIPVGSLSDWLTILRPEPETPAQPDEVGAGEPSSPPVEENPDE